MFVYNEPFILCMVIDAAGFAHNYASHISAWEIWCKFYFYLKVCGSL